VGGHEGPLQTGPMDLAEVSSNRQRSHGPALASGPAQPRLRVPIPFGHWQLSRDRLDCRLPRECVTVRAPRKLLGDVARLCDGTRSWSSVIDALARTWSPEAVTPFLADLAEANVLVEAGELWAHWSELAQLPQATAASATADEVGGLPLLSEGRLLPGEGQWAGSVRTGQNELAAVLRMRESIRTFDDRPLSIQVLCSILWAAHGVTRASEVEAPRWHRTVGSGGNMHSVRWFVAVLRSLPSTAPGEASMPPGIYEARFHCLGGASLQGLPTDLRQAWTCLRDPRVLRYASALILPLHDVAVPARKYGNRATLFAALEAGLCLQNAQLMATSLGAACMLRGDTVGSAAIALAGMRPDGHHWLSVPAMVVGAMPSAEQKRQQQLESRFSLAPNLQPKGMEGTAAPQFAFAAIGHAGTVATAPAAVGSGRAADPRLALDVAEAEAWERVGWATLARTRGAAARELPQALDARELVAYSARQHRTPGFPFSRFDPARFHLWSEVLDTDTGAQHAVPAECVHALHALPAHLQETACTSASTSGVAAGTTVQDALTRATLELVERDAFCRCWLSGVPAPGIDPGSLPRELQARVAALEAQGAHVCLVDLSTAWCSVIAVFLQSVALPLTAITAAAAFDPAWAAAKALSEAEGRLASAQHFPCTAAGADPMRAIENFYRQPRTFRRSDFFRPAHTSRRFIEVGRGSATDWEGMRDRLRTEGFKLLCADITPAEAAIEQGRRPLQVVRALIPGLVPIWFQRGLHPAGMKRFIQASGERRGRPAGHFLHPFT
jgi:ribosomal protein S12 methylthiotransferase accessory factor